MDMLLRFVAVATFALSGTANASEISVEVRQALRRRINLSESRIVLRSIDGERLRARPPAGFDEAGLLSALEAVTGLPVTATSMQDGVIKLSNGRLEVGVLPSLGRVRSSAMELAVDSLPDLAVEEKLKTDSTQLARAFGARDEEMTWAEVRGVGAADDDSGVSAGRARRVAHLVYIQRSIGGVRINGDRLIAEYALDGTLRGVRGQWRKVNYGASVLSTALTEEGVVQRALDLLVEMEIAPDSDLPIRIFTQYEVLPGNGHGEYKLRLEGVVEVGLHGPSGSRKKGLYRFSL